MTAPAAIGSRPSRFAGRTPRDVDADDSVSSPEMSQVLREPAAFVHWVCRYAQATYWIYKPRRKFNENNGEYFWEQGLKVDFNKGHCFVRRDHPDFEAITDVLTHHADYRSGDGTGGRRLVCLDEISKEQQEILKNPELVGVNEATVLSATVGIKSPEQMERIKRLLKIGQDIETSKLRDDKAKLEDQLQKAQAALAEKAKGENQDIPPPNTEDPPQQL